jgi:hypothetical protein
MTVGGTGLPNEMERAMMRIAIAIGMMILVFG